jgi:branched-chain amino acid transport system permease protein
LKLTLKAAAGAFCLLVLTGCATSAEDSTSAGCDSEIVALSDGTGYRLAGNVRLDDVPIEGAVVEVEVLGAKHSVCSDVEGQWVAYVSDSGEYVVTLDEETVPEGAEPDGGEWTQTRTSGSAQTVTVNFLLSSEGTT